MASLLPGRFYYDSSGGIVVYAALPGKVLQRPCSCCPQWHGTISARVILHFRRPRSPASLVIVGEDPTTWLPGALLAEALPVVVDVAGARGVSFSGNLSVRHGAANLEAFCVNRNGVYHAGAGGGEAAHVLYPPRVGAGCGSQSAVDVPIATVMVRSGSSDVQFRGVEIAWVSGWAATVESGTTGVVFEGCHVHDVGSGAIRHIGLSANGTHATTPSMYPRTGGIRAGSTGAQGAVDVQVTDCTIERGGSVLPAGPGILFQVR